MSRFALVSVLVALAVCAQGFPYNENDVASAAARGDWDTVHRLLSEKIRSRYELNPIGFGLRSVDIKNLKPQPGGHVYGESKFEYHSASDVNGLQSEQSGGHRVINDDGRITEYEYKPQQKQLSQ